MAWGFALLILLPDSIDKAFFFSAEEKLIAKQRLQNERTTSAEKRWRWDHVGALNVLGAVPSQAKLTLRLTGQRGSYKRELLVDCPVLFLGKLDHRMSPSTYFEVASMG